MKNMKYKNLIVVGAFAFIFLSFNSVFAYAYTSAYSYTIGPDMSDYYRENNYTNENQNTNNNQNQGYTYQDQNYGREPIEAIVISKLPIKRIDFSNPTEKSQHDRIVSLVDHMLALNKALASATLPHDRDSLTAQIAATDRQIDELVFGLYGLSEEERKVILNS